MQVMAICTGNVCRSPAVARLLRSRLADVRALQVTSAGVAAVPGGDICAEMSRLLNGRRVDASPDGRHTSRMVNPEALSGADLILVAERLHVAEVVRLAPAALQRTFTLRAAAGLAAFVLEQCDTAMEPGCLPSGAPSLPPRSHPAARLRWLVSEMNEARGLAMPFPARDPSALRWRWRGPKTNVVDIPDPHQGVRVSHAQTFGLLDAATESLAATIRRLLEV